MSRRTITTAAQRTYAVRAQQLRKTLTAKALANRLDLPLELVKMIVRRPGIAFRGATPFQRAFIARAIKVRKRLTVRAIAARLRLPAYTVTYWSRTKFRLAEQHQAAIAAKRRALQGLRAPTSAFRSQGASR